MQDTYTDFSREPSKPHQCMHHSEEDGTRCRATAMHNEIMCFHHRSYDIPPVIQNAPFLLENLDTRAAIQRALGELAARLACNQMDLVRARILLQTLQSAMRNLPPIPRAAAGSAPAISQAASTDAPYAPPPGPAATLRPAYVPPGDDPFPPPPRPPQLQQNYDPEPGPAESLSQNCHPERSAAESLPKICHPEHSAAESLPQNCHPERSAAESKDLRSLQNTTNPAPQPTTIPALTAATTREPDAEKPRRRADWHNGAVF